MSTDKAGEIIKRAMAASKRGPTRWLRVKMKSGEKSFQIGISRTQRSKNMKAGATLGISRNNSSLYRVAKEKGLTFEHGLTLGCGAGRCERDLISGGVSLSFHGIDISEHAVAKAREVAGQRAAPAAHL